MIVLASRDGLTVTDKENFKGLHVELVDLTDEEFGDLVRANDAVAPHDEADHVWISTEMLHRALETASDPARAKELNGMLDFAASKGWMDPTGSYVAAHVADQ